MSVADLMSKYKGMLRTVVLILEKCGMLNTTDLILGSDEMWNTLELMLDKLRHFRSS